MSQVSTALRIAKGEVGYREGFANGHWDNHQKYSAEVPSLTWSQDQAWCATFISWVAMKAGEAELFPCTASCTNAVQWYRDRGRFSEYPAVGGQVFYGPGGGSHTGIVYAYDANYIYTVEGNTNDDGSPEGNGVYLKRRERRSAFTYGYGLPKYAEGIVTADPALRGKPGYTYATAANDVAQVGPAPKPVPKPTGKTRTVVVKAGQYLGMIAAAAGCSVAAILALNPNIHNPNQITPGETITVPAAPSSTRPVPTPSTSATHSPVSVPSASPSASPTSKPTLVLVCTKE